MQNIRIVLLAVALIVAGCAVPVVIENPPGSGNLSTNYTTDPRFTNTIGTIGAINDATAGVNPFHSLIAIGLGAIASGAAWWAKYKNTKQQLTSVVAGVEAVASDAVKKSIKSQAIADKIEGDLNKTVKRVTGG